MTQPSPVFQPQIPPPPHNSYPRRRKLIIGLVLGGVLFLAAFVLGIFWLVFSLLKGSDAGKEAFARARANPAVVQQLGTPIEEGWFATGSITVSGGSGNADLALPISGPKGKATVYVTAKKVAGDWTYSVIRVVIDGSGQRIDLLPEGTLKSDDAH